MPSWAKPSRVAAATGVAVGVGTLIFAPLPNGDNWVRRALTGYTAYKAGGGTDPELLLATDSSGNDITTIAMMQIKQNALPAIGYTAGFGLVAAALKHFGM
jgi:hypothetical protein